MTSRRDYALARVHARRTRLLGRAGLDELLSAPGTQARIRILYGSDWGRTIVGRAERDVLRGVDRGLRVRIAEEAAAIDAWLAGGRLRRLWRAALRVEDARLLRTAIRGLARNETPDDILSMLSPTPSFPEAAVREVARAGSPKGAVDLLATWGSPLAPPLEEALGAWISRRDALALEHAVDRAAFTAAFAESRGFREDARVVRGFLARSVDATNARTLLLGTADAPFLRGGLLLREKAFREIALLDRMLRYGALARLDPAFAPLADAADPWAAEERLRAMVDDWVKLQARRRPLSIAVALDYLVARRAEARSVRIVLRGGAAGWPRPRLEAALAEAPA